MPLLSKLAEPFLVKINEREAETMLHNLRERLESGDVGAQPAHGTTDKRV